MQVLDPPPHTHTISACSVVVVVVLQHCDAFAASIYPEMSEKARGTFINALSFDFDQVTLAKIEDAQWEVSMDKQVVSQE